jgi:tRNA (guanine-N7-)-methyltransferase
MWPKQNSAPKILEIGFGMGETTAQIAQIRSDDQFLAIEVHEPGVGALLKKIGEMNLANLRLMQHDAVEVLRNKIEAEVLDGVHIFFPDPWHKKRHHKRRLIQEEFVGLLISRLKLEGYIHLATDWQPYAEQMLAVLNARTELLNLSTDKTYSPKPVYRPITKFEKRGLSLGHGVWDLMFKKIEVNKI